MESVRKVRGCRVVHGASVAAIVLQDLESAAGREPPAILTTVRCRNMRTSLNLLSAVGNLPTKWTFGKVTKLGVQNAKTVVVRPTSNE
jgi:hypothetical protein